MYKPKYDMDVQVGILMDDGSLSYAVPVNPLYCLNPDSANELATLLNTNGMGPVRVEMLPPIFPMFRFQYSRAVPWFVYVNGTKENAGFVSMNFIEGRSESQALVYAGQEIAGCMSGN